MEVQQPIPKKKRHFPWLRAIIALLISLLISAAAILLILSTEHVIAGYWLVIIPVALTAFGQLIPLYQYLLPISTETKSDHSLSPPLPVEVKVTLTPPVPEPTAQHEQSRQPEGMWTVPYQRNMFFTGREKLLTQLHEQLTSTNAAALTQSQAISGLGGVGKTQIALEYAYRYREEYTSILWLNAQSPESLLIEFITLADLLHLPQPEKDEHYQTRLIALVKQWFEQHDSWLLILDNADDLNMVRTYLPTGSQGRIILTTREHATGNITNIAVEKMTRQEGTTCLLQRLKLLSPGTSLEQVVQDKRAQAEYIVEELDGLPLALDQAGAYLEETGCDISDYLERYRQQRERLLDRRGRSTSTEHPLSVTATILLCVTQLRQRNILGVDLLRCLAFLAPDDIPDDLLKAGAAQLGPHLQAITTDESLFDEAISDLLRFSLIQRHTEQHASSLHRLVQAVLKDDMSVEEQHTWKERVIRAIGQAIPSNHSANWQRYLSHAWACATLIMQEPFLFPEAARLLDTVASYLFELTIYSRANAPLLALVQKFTEHALAIKEQALSPTDPSTAASLNNLATLYSGQGKYEQAETLYQRALALSEQTLGPTHDITGDIMNNLAEFYLTQGKYEQAEPLYQRALAIREQTLGSTEPITKLTFHSLALLYEIQDKYEQVETLYQRALALSEQTLGSTHPDTAESLNNLAEFYDTQGKYEQAEPLYQRALAILEKALGPNHADTMEVRANRDKLLEHMKGKKQ